MNRVELVLTFSWWREWNWCSPLADEESGIGAHLFLMNLEWNWCPPLAWWTRRGLRGGGWWERWSRPAGTRRTRPNASTRPPILLCVKPQVLSCDLLASLFPFAGCTSWKGYFWQHWVHIGYSKQDKKYFRNIGVTGYVPTFKTKRGLFTYCLFMEKMQICCIWFKLVEK